MTLYNVYVPAVNYSDNISVNDGLKIFSTFFSVDSEEDMKRFIELYSDNTLCKRLITSYSKAVLRGDLKSIQEREYFDMKITEQDIMEAKIEAREEGRAEGRAEGQELARAEGRKEGILQGFLSALAELVRDGLLSAPEAAKRAGMPLNEFVKTAGLSV